MSQDNAHEINEEGMPEGLRRRHNQAGRAQDVDVAPMLEADEKVDGGVPAQAAEVPAAAPEAPQRERGCCSRRAMGYAVTAACAVGYFAASAIPRAVVAWPLMSGAALLASITAIATGIRSPALDVAATGLFMAGGVNHAAVRADADRIKEQYQELREIVANKEFQKGTPEAQAHFHKALGYAKQGKYKLAVKYYTLSADGGCASAAFNLARLYYFGQGAEQNIEKAREWAAIAAAGGQRDAVDMLEYLHNEVPPPDIRAVM